MCFLWDGPLRAVDQWKAIGAPREIIEGITSGVRARWNHGPPPSFNFGASLEGSSKEEKQWFRQEIQRLLKLGVLRVTRTSRHISRVFLVPKKGPSQWRMVVDLRHVNQWATEGTAEVETLREVKNVARPGDWACSLDLSDGYYHFRLEEDSIKFFAFSFEGVIYELVGLNMGWTRSPGVFTDMLRPAVRWLRQKGTRLLWYLDDFLLPGGSPEEVREHRDRAVGLFRRLGLSLQEHKCVWEPTQRLTHLGLVLDFKEGLFEVCPKKLAKIERAAKQLQRRAASAKRRVNKLELAALVGLAQFCHLAVAPARMHLRACYDALGSTAKWSGTVVLTRQALRDLQWWQQLRSSGYNGAPIWRPLETLLATTDASKIGWGATITLPDRVMEARGFWTAGEVELHIGLLELRAVVKLMETYAGVLSGHRVRLLCDNQSVVYIINKGTSKAPAMMAEARKLWYLCDQARVTLHVQYIRSEDNVRADALSRVRHKGLTISSILFGKLDGPTHTVDRFASELDALLPRWNAYWPCPGSEGTDALSQTDENWAMENNWCHPPPNLLTALAQKLMQSGAAATVLAPKQEHKLFFQLLRELSSRVIQVPRWSGFVPLGSHRQARLLPRWDYVAFKIPRRAPAANTREPRNMGST